MANGEAGETGVHSDPFHSLLADRKSTRLNSSHLVISYAVFCLKKKTNSNLNPCKLYESVQTTRALMNKYRRRHYSELCRNFCFNYRIPILRYSSHFCRPSDEL